MQKLKFSLIVPTLNREQELEHLLVSLAQQTYKNYELIIVDQNQDERLNTLLDKYKNKLTALKHIKTDSRGASKARNIGIKNSSGDILTFPDDDCEYATDVLEETAQIFQNNEYDIVTGMHVEIWPQHSLKKLKLIPLNIYNIWVKGIEFVIFLRRPVINTVGFFDESLGVGSSTIYGSGEGTDYLLRALQNNFKIVNCNSIIIKHEKAVFYKPDSHLKAFRYSVGRRYVLDKYKYNYLFILINIWHPLLKLLFSFYNFKKVKYYWFQFLGRFHFAKNMKM